MSPLPKKSEQNDAEKLASLIEDEKQARAKETEILQSSANRVKKKKIIVYTSFGVAIALVMGTLIFYDPFTNSIRWGDGISQVAAGKNPEETKKPIVQASSENWWEEDSNKFPVGVPEWSREAYDSEKRDSFLDSANETYFSTQVGMIGSALPSEAAGYTSDVSKQFLENGNTNPMFSYWTDRVFTSEVGSMLERLLNPIHGDWSGAYYGDNNMNALQDLFSENYLIALGDNPANYPILLERLDENLLEQGFFWVGTLQGIRTNLNYDSLRGQYQGTATVDILYTAWTKDRNTVTKNATLQLTLASNAGKALNTSENRIIITDSSLVVH